MSVDKLVDSTQLDSDLASVANAIRARGGTSADLAFPSGFVSAVGAIGNQYSAGDEGKVVSNGELVAQTAHAEVNQNGTIDTTLNDSVTVNVSGGGGGALTLHTGTFTPATNTTTMEITGLGAPAMIVRFGVTENATDGVTKITAGIYAAGAFAISRTNANAGSNVGDYYPSPGNVFNNRTVYNDGSAPTTADRIFVTKTGFVVRAPNGTYGFKAGYTYKWECYTYPES